MSLDLKVYISNKLDLDDKDCKMIFIDYFQVHSNGSDYNTYDDILGYHVKFDEKSDDEDKVFNSYVFKYERFLIKIRNPPLKNDIIKAIEKLKKTMDLEDIIVVCQPF